MNATPELRDDRRDDFRDDVLAGLAAQPRTLPCKYFYDKAGSLLFDQICALPEYYLTRAETALLEAHVDDLAEVIGPDAVLVELGSGSSVKTRLLLDRLTALARYVPVDISATHLHDTAATLRDRYPALRVEPVVADYAHGLPAHEALAVAPGTAATVFFPGSSIGNFAPDEAAALLGRMRALAGPGGRLLVGVDAGAEADVVRAAYDDAAGVTAAFNKNLLVRINRELGGTFDLAQFTHQALWDREHHRIEMRLVSEVAQTVRVAGRVFRFGDGDVIVTEHCHKYDVARFRALARRAGLEPGRLWQDPSGRMAMHELRVAPAGQRAGRVMRRSA